MNSLRIRHVLGIFQLINEAELVVRIEIVIDAHVVLVAVVAIHSLLNVCVQSVDVAGTAYSRCVQPVADCEVVRQWHPADDLLHVSARIESRPACIEPEQVDGLHGAWIERVSAAVDRWIGLQGIAIIEAGT